MRLLLGVILPRRLGQRVKRKCCGAAPGRDPRAQLPEAAAMLDRWAYVEFLRFEALCFLSGAVLGLVVALVRGSRDA